MYCSVTPTLFVRMHHGKSSRGDTATRCNTPLFLSASRRPHTLSFTHAHIQTRTGTRTHAHTHTHKHKHTNTHTHTDAKFLLKFTDGKVFWHRRVLKCALQYVAVCAAVCCSAFGHLRHLCAVALSLVQET